MVSSMAAVLQTKHDGAKEVTFSLATLETIDDDNTSKNAAPSSAGVRVRSKALSICHHTRGAIHVTHCVEVCFVLSLRSWWAEIV